MNFLDKMISDLRGSRQFNQNEGLAGMARPVQGYQTNGLTDREANELAQRQLINQKVQDAAVADMIAKNREASDADMILRSAQTPDAQGKYKSIGSVDGFNENVPYGAGRDPVVMTIDKLQQYLINKKVDAVNNYQDSIDQGLAAKWMQSYKGR